MLINRQRHNLLICINSLDKHSLKKTKKLLFVLLSKLFCDLTLLMVFNMEKIMQLFKTLVCIPRGKVFKHLKVEIQDNAE